MHAQDHAKVLTPQQQNYDLFVTDLSKKMKIVNLQRQEF